MIPQQSKKVFLVINKFAGHRKCKIKLIDKIINFLQKNNCTVSFEYTQYHGHAKSIATEAVRKGFQLVVAFGGDGTVNEVAQGLLGTPAVLGIIPAGSGNGFARELGISMNLIASAHTLIDGTVKNTDVCLFNNKPFLCTCGIGFDARVADQMNKSTSRGFFRYIQLTAKESLTFKPFGVRLLLDDRYFEEKIFMVTFANISQFGNHAIIAPQAKIDDGLIDVIVIKPFRKIWLPILAILLFTRYFPRLPIVEYIQVRKAEILQTDADSFHLDGEPQELILPSKMTIHSGKIPVMSAK
ncbi:MAG: diacylglycerol kinase family protein [Mariniphaga sp.]|nr:diacylglycerol kinase family lipid kinase [Mariniphaga sp.]